MIATSQTCAIFLSPVFHPGASVPGRCAKMRPGPGTPHLLPDSCQERSVQVCRNEAPGFPAMARKVLLVTTVDLVSTARYAAGFAAAAWTVDALSPRRAPVRLSRYVAASHRYHPLRALASL